MTFADLVSALLRELERIDPELARSARRLHADVLDRLEEDPRGYDHGPDVYWTTYQLMSMLPRGRFVIIRDMNLTSLAS